MAEISSTVYQLSAIQPFQCSSASRKFLNAYCGARCALVSMFQCSSASRKFLNRRCRFGRSGDGEFQCSSASRKFLNYPYTRDYIARAVGFSALQRAENSSMLRAEHNLEYVMICFSALQRAENSSMRFGISRCRARSKVSVLFSEPKIPQCRRRFAARCRSESFSALQRAENSSMFRHLALSSEIKSFSALQRAENSSIQRTYPNPAPHPRFQCSSASRKFLNRIQTVNRIGSGECFSALQRAENSSIYPFNRFGRSLQPVSVLFSEPKIPQSYRHAAACCWRVRFQCSSASRKFLNLSSGKFAGFSAKCFSALQRAENSSIHILRKTRFLSAI